MITSINNIQTANAVTFGKKAKNNQVYNNPYAQLPQKEEKKKSKVLLWLLGIGAALAALAKFGAKKDETKVDDKTKTNEHGDTFVKNDNDEIIIEPAEELVEEPIDEVDEVIEEVTPVEEEIDEEVAPDVAEEIEEETPVEEEAAPVEEEVAPVVAEEIEEETPVEEEVAPVVAEEIEEEIIPVEEETAAINEEEAEDLSRLPESGQISFEHTNPEAFDGLEEVVPAAVAAATSEEITKDEVNPDQMSIDDIKIAKKRTYKPKTDEQRSREVQKKASQILDKSSAVIADAKSDFEYAHGIIRETKKIGRQAQKQGYADIVNPDGSVVKFNTTTEKGETILNNIVEYDANGNLVRKSNLHEGMIWSVMVKNPETGKVDIVEVDREGILLAKGYENNGENYNIDKVFNFTFVDRSQEGELSTGKLTEYAENLVVQENFATISEAYKFGEDEIVDEYAIGVRVKSGDIGSTRGVYKFDDTTIQEKAKTYKGSLTGAKEGLGTGVYKFENGKFVEFKNVAVKTTDVIAD